MKNVEEVGVELVWAVSEDFFQDDSQVPLLAVGKDLVEVVVVLLVGGIVEDGEGRELYSEGLGDLA